MSERDVMIRICLNMLNEAIQNYYKKDDKQSIDLDYIHLQIIDYCTAQLRKTKSMYVKT